MENYLGYICGSKSWGGLEMNQLKNAIWMKKRGHKVVILCWKNSPIDIKANEKEIPVINIPIHKKYYDFKNAFLLKRIIHKEKINHLLVRSNHDLSISASVKFLLKGKIQTSFFMEMQFGINKTSIFHTIRFNLFDNWSCPLEWLKVQMENKTRINKSKIRVINSGIEQTNYENTFDKKSLRNNFNLPDNRLIFGLFGRIDENKGHHILIEALNFSKHKDYIILIVGEPTLNENDEYYHQIKKLILDKNLENRFIFRSFTNSIEQYYHAIDCIINTTKSETVGMTTIEAFASGIPVIGSNAGGTKELIHSSKLGLLFESFNHIDLANKLDFFIENIEFYDSKVIKDEAKKFDSELICQKVEEFLSLSTIK